MSDILIREMELEPGRIAELIIAPDGGVYKNKWDFCVGLKPIGHAIKLPPHGDLIERSDVLAVVDEAYVYGDIIKRKDFGENSIPTIVPAERREV